MIEAFGDNHNKSNCAFRYVFQNINGKFNNSIQKNHALTPIFNLQPDVTGLAETNVMWSSTQRKEYNNVLKHHWPHTKSAMSHCQDKDHSPKKVHLQGGTA